MGCNYKCPRSFFCFWGQRSRWLWPENFWAQSLKNALREFVKFSTNIHVDLRVTCLKFRGQRYLAYCKVKYSGIFDKCEMDIWNKNLLSNFPNSFLFVLYIQTDFCWFTPYYLYNPVLFTFSKTPNKSRRLHVHE